MHTPYDSIEKQFAGWLLASISSSRDTIFSFHRQGQWADVLLSKNHAMRQESMSSTSSLSPSNVLTKSHSRSLWERRQFSTLYSRKPGHSITENSGCVSGEGSVLAHSLTSRRGVLIMNRGKVYLRPDDQNRRTDLY